MNGFPSLPAGTPSGRQQDFVFFFESGIRAPSGSAAKSKTEVSMKRYAVIFAALVFLAGIMVARASAQAAARFDVPFSFTANHQILPAGLYRVQLEFGRPVLTLFNTRTGDSNFLIARPNPGSRMEERGTLVFFVNGADHYLKEARLPGTSLGAALLVPRVYELKTAEGPAPLASTIQIAAR